MERAWCPVLVMVRSGSGTPSRSRGARGLVASLEALRPDADRLVERLFDELRDPDQVFAKLRADETLSDSMRQAALQAVMRRGQAAPPSL